MPCTVDKILKSTDTWADKPSRNDMLQETELLKLIDTVHCTGAIVASFFVSRRLQPCKERARPMYDFLGPKDPSRESHAPEARMSRDAVTRWMTTGPVQYQQAAPIVSFASCSVFVFSLCFCCHDCLISCGLTDHTWPGSWCIFLFCFGRMVAGR